jgi:hypothetical protein
LGDVVAHGVTSNFFAGLPRLGSTSAGLCVHIIAVVLLLGRPPVLLLRASDVKAAVAPSTFSLQVFAIHVHLAREVTYTYLSLTCTVHQEKRSFSLGTGSLAARQACRYGTPARVRLTTHAAAVAEGERLCVPASNPSRKRTGSALGVKLVRQPLAEASALARLY